MKAAQYMPWFYQTDMAAYLTGEWKRVKAVEYQLPRLVKAGKLIAINHGKPLIYHLPFYGNRKGYYSEASIPHDLMCTTILLRAKISAGGKPVSTRFFRKMKFGSVPDVVMRFDGEIVMIEYSTADNCGRPWVMKRKYAQYMASVPKVGEFFGLTPIVLFVLDIPRYEVKAEATDKPFFYTDLTTFMKQDIREQLQEPIYIWGGNGETYPLMT